MTGLISISSPEDFRSTGVRNEITRIQTAIELAFTSAIEHEDGTVTLKAYLETAPDEKALKMAVNEYLSKGWTFMDIVTTFEPFGYTMDIRMGYTVEQEEED